MQMTLKLPNCYLYGTKNFYLRFLFDFIFLNKKKVLYESAEQLTDKQTKLREELEQNCRWIQGNAFKYSRTQQNDRGTKDYHVNIMI